MAHCADRVDSISLILQYNLSLPSLKTCYVIGVIESTLCGTMKERIQHKPLYNKKQTCKTVTRTEIIIHYASTFNLRWGILQKIQQRMRIILFVLYDVITKMW